MNRPRRILFVAEAVTLAHLSRPLVLAKSLDRNEFEVHFACADRYDTLFRDTGFRRWKIDSVSSESFLHSLATGSRLYSYQTLSRYVQEDLQLLNEVRPDLVIGDFRLSLAVSAAVARVPYAAIANVYWSPYSTLKNFPLPDLPISRIVGHSLAESIFHLCQPLIFAYHARPINKLRRECGLAELGGLLHVYTHGDYTLYADPPDLFPTARLPSNHRFLGHIEWSPEIEPPEWWNDLKAGLPVIYVNLGSSGPAQLLPAIITALAELPVTVIMATAGRWKPKSLPPNIYSCDYLPGSDALSRATLVICNGGSPSVYQAFGRGVPVIGIPANMDQLLCMQAIERNRTGIALRPVHVTEKSVRDAVIALTSDQSYTENARRTRDRVGQINAIQRFKSFVSEVVEKGARRNSPSVRLVSEL